MEAYFATMFEEVRHERFLNLLLLLTGSDYLKQSKNTEDEINKIRNVAPEKLHRQRVLKEYEISSDLEEQFSKL